ncbi:MAG: type I 3-dehydroquinate dehydratase [Planctomycetes bacterium]|nr:type I 3-dehydroquinate dehydratase [Planctomycetota bacterium]
MPATLPICLVLHGSLAQVRTDLTRLEPSVTVVELRLDAIPDLDPSRAALEALITSSPVPLIATCRPEREGGYWKSDEPSRLALLASAAHAGAAWVDVEADAVADLPPLPGEVSVLVSAHPSGLTCAPDQRSAALSAQLASLRHPRAQALKLALPCDDARDALTLLRLASQETLPTLAIGMGFPGVATRILGPAAGGPWTYAAPRQDSSLAAGQLTPSQLGGIAKDAQAWFGVIGAPVAHSRSPHLMNAVFERLGLSAAYSWLETEDPGGLLDQADLDGRWAGFSITIPHKSTLLERVELAPEAAAAGALNTLVRTARGWRGHNTDGLAVELLLGDRVADDLRELPVALLGNGGAARAAAAVLRAAGAQVRVYTRHEARGRAFAAEFNLAWGGSLDALPTAESSGSPRVILNATSVGMTPDEDSSPVRAEVFGPEQVAYDLVYTPPETRFLQDAATRGAGTISGVDHFLTQAAAQLGLFWGDRTLDLPALDDPWWRRAARLD